MKALGLVKETQIHKHPQKKGFPYTPTWLVSNFLVRPASS